MKSTEDLLDGLESVEKYGGDTNIVLAKIARILSAEIEELHGIRVALENSIEKKKEQ